MVGLVLLAQTEAGGRQEQEDRVQLQQLAVLQLIMQAAAARVMARTE